MAGEAGPGRLTQRAYAGDKLGAFASQDTAGHTRAEVWSYALGALAEEVLLPHQLESTLCSALATSADVVYVDEFSNVDGM